MGTTRARRCRPCAERPLDERAGGLRGPASWSLRWRSAGVGVEVACCGDGFTGTGAVRRRDDDVGRACVSLPGCRDRDRRARAGATTSKTSANQSQSPGYRRKWERQAFSSAGTTPCGVGSRAQHSMQYSWPLRHAGAAARAGVRLGRYRSHRVGFGRRVPLLVAVRGLLVAGGHVVGVHRVVGDVAAGAAEARVCRKRGAAAGAADDRLAGGRPQLAQKCAAQASGAPHSQRRPPRWRRAVLALPERVVELVDALLEHEDLAALLEQQVLAEAAAAHHLEREAADVADPILADAAQRTPLAAEGPPGVPAGGWRVVSRRNRMGSAAPRPKSERPAIAEASALGARLRLGGASEGEYDEALLGELAHGVGRALARVAAVLDAAVGHLVGAEGRRLVDDHPAEMEPRGGAQRRRHVGGEDAGLQAEGRAVGEVDGLVERVVRRDRPPGRRPPRTRPSIGRRDPRSGRLEQAVLALAAAGEHLGAGARASSIHSTIRSRVRRR